MRLRIAALAVFAATIPAGAQPAPAPQQPPYAPITVDEQGYNALRAYLGQQPYAFAAPLMQWLDQAEAKAALAAAAVSKAIENAKKSDPVKPADQAPSNPNP